MRVRLVPALAALSFACCAPAVARAASPAAQPFAAAGARSDAVPSLPRAPFAQRGGGFELTATLSRASAPAAAAMPLGGGGYALAAVASASNLVCYDDTLFRDDFDGDGF